MDPQNHTLTGQPVPWPAPAGSVSTNGRAPDGSGPVTAQTLMTADQFQDLSRRILTSINTVIDGKARAAEIALTVLLARGHLLVEDVPGVGKTLLAKTLARTIDCSVSRIQFTPDLLPSDITGVSIYNQSTQNFEFRAGAVFANIVIGDEINRASAKTQSALLESMEEHRVTTDGTSHRLPEPFMVVATQNPIEMEGTYPLPEAQRDRFMARISMGYPDRASEIDMLSTHQSVSPLEAVRSIATVREVAAMMDIVDAVYVSSAVKEYIVRLGQATRENTQLRLGASPRALLQLLRAAKAHAALDQRNFVVPDDVVTMADVVLAHRLILERRSASTGQTASGVIAALLDGQPVSPARSTRSGVQR
ncbi:AAA family ATPase [Arthrobacter sp. H14-L1]|uniref:AAA family ATPase n=1 Tax=Arthrobacter sp. H14-L1 TaxID=2996697 RepID=UPI0022706A3B|nr:MoxR family ATPase [Arthrobacter sp. H14-L1]MCY0904954.1 MoxR family ATPase [Arthrobacter sp. H14-L1]